MLVFEEVELPRALKGKLGGFMAELDLFCGSFDLVVDEAGEYWFLECNEDGQWTWLDGEVGGTFASAIARQAGW